MIRDPERLDRLLAQLRDFVREECIPLEAQIESFVVLGQAFEITASRSHGHVQAVALTLQRLGFAGVLASKPCRERELVLAMVASRIVEPHTKLATTRWWYTTTLAEEFGGAEASEDDLYTAMDWLLAREYRVQKKLAARPQCRRLGRWVNSSWSALGAFGRPTKHARWLTTARRLASLCRLLRQPLHRFPETPERSHRLAPIIEAKQLHERLTPAAGVAIDPNDKPIGLRKQAHLALAGFCVTLRCGDARAQALAR